MQSNKPNEPIKPAYPLGDANADPKQQQQEQPKKDPTKAPEPHVVNEPQTDG